MKAALRNPLTITIGIIVILGVLIYAASQIWTEVLWFDQLGAARVLWTRWGATAGLFVITFAIQFAALMGAVTWAYRTRPQRLVGQSGSNLREYQAALEPFRKVVFWGIPAVISFMTAAGMASQWQTFLVWWNRTPFGEVDPQFGIDISFYVFTLPILEIVLSFLLNTLVVAVLAVIVIGYLYGGITFSPRFNMTNSARMQIGLLGAGLSLVVALRYWVGIYSLVLKNGELVDGALYKEVNAVLPAQMILAVISLLVAVLFVIAAFRGTWRLPAVGVAVTVVSALVVGGAYPALIQQFRVTPNARQMETPYIQRNIDATLAAFGLDEVDYQTYAAKTDVAPGQLRGDAEATSQIRLLDPMVISPTVRQLQQSRPYYTFDSKLSVDRYTIDGDRRDTVIAVRDINQSGLQPEQQTWVNMHTVYTHGFGVVAAYGNTVRPDGTPAFWESSIPSVGEMGDYEPRVYFSKTSPEYSIVGAPEGAVPQELDYPDDNAPSGQVQTTFSGDGGPSVGNPWNKLLYAIKFGSTDIFFSQQTNSESQILYDRDPMLRVAKVAPYLNLEQKAYPAVVDMDGDESTPKRLVWIVDAYTTSANYPYSERVSLGQATIDSRTDRASMFSSDTVNYIRNSVKAVVDAYDGSVTLYTWDSEDPILASWKGVYPGMIQDMSEVSGDLMSHFRYPEDLFKVQRSLLETYHVTEAAEFYTGGDRWRLSEDPTTTATDTATGTQQVQAPYYLTMQMPGQESAEFSLTSVYVPAGGGESRRAAMAGFLAVDSETGNTPGEVREDYGKLRLMALPSSTTVPGPGQVQNNFNTDQTVATQLNLLSQQGSSVIRGNLLTLPVGGGLLYVQPVYVQSTGSTSYPVLRYVLTAFGEQVGFAATLNEALDQTFAGDAQATTGDGEVEPGAEGEEGAEPTVPVTSEQALNDAILKARDAMLAADAAMKAGDWTAYGKAQEALDAALNELVRLQELANDPPAAGEGAQSGADESFGTLGENAETATDGN
ncbi:UPF0182 family membrane protein [Actinomyces minihominis]|uniref:UPF0182 family membrane protein n=1 Tax=Actinomyces minihominis TaxID=2002838 RepID=UPI000C086632|nr:UPF0182 family protein [Actinomyces minihominis]